MIDASFEIFFSECEPRLRRALCATYGASTGRAATVDALSWAWEHWDRLVEMDNPVGYLYRVGQTASKRYRIGQLPIDRSDETRSEIGDLEPRLGAAVENLSEQQRCVVVLVHGFEWRKSEVARHLDVSESTVNEHLRRAMNNIRIFLEVQHA